MNENPLIIYDEKQLQITKRHTKLKRYLSIVFFVKLTLVGIYSGHLQHYQRKRELYKKYKFQVDSYEIWKRRKAIEYFKKLNGIKLMINFL